MAFLRGFGQNGGCILGVSYGYVWGIIWHDIEVDTWTSRRGTETGRWEERDGSVGGAKEAKGRRLER